MTQSSQRFCLRWNNHQSNLLSVFDQLLQDESFVDVTLAVEGQFLRAHKMVLSACSPYFQTLFVGHPDKHPIVILKDVPFADMRSLLDFMYRGEVSVDQDRLSAFLKVAESLRIKGLTEVNEDKCDTQSSLSSLISNPPSSSSAPPPPDLHRIQLSQPSHKRSSTPSSLNGATSPYSQKRKRGRPRKLSESSDGGDESPDRDSAVLDSDSKQLDSSYGNGPPDLLEVNMSDHPLNTSGALSDDGNESPERVISQEQEAEDFCFINNIKREIDEPNSPDNKNSSRENNVGMKSQISNHQSSERCPADLPILHLIPKGELMNAYQKKEKDYSIVDSENNNIFMRHGVQTTSPVILNNGDINHHNYSPPSHLLSPTQNMTTGSGNGNGNNDCFSGVPPAKPNPARRRVRRRTACGNDPAEQLTEMSVRGLNLFRYASIDAGVYRCMECDKTGITKTFKNKYSFQRHAFLYHEGCQRKVFPCSICGKEFSRPDKMKNHLKTVHDYFVPKDYLIQPPPSIPYFISPSS